MGDDEEVQKTNDDASLSKRFAVDKGYWKDRYIRFFTKAPERKAPEISRGYFARVHGLAILQRQFLNLTQGKCQFVSLGAGSDTLFWRLHDAGIAPLRFFEVDFPNVVQRKCLAIKTRRSLLDALVSPTVSPERVLSQNYCLLPGDLRDTRGLEEILLEAGLDKSLPTLIVLECVLIYLQPTHSEALLRWAGRSFATSVLVNYEPYMLTDHFGQVMVENLKGRGLDLPGKAACTTLQAQIDRFVSNGWQSAHAQDMNSVYQALPQAEVQRIERLEFLDEAELLHQLLQHYCISWAVNDSASLGLKDIGYYGQLAITTDISFL